MFPFTIRSTITIHLNGNSPELVAGILRKRISDRMQSRGLKLLASEPNSISFALGITGFRSGGLLEFIDQGRISTRPEGDSLLLSFELSYLRGIIIMSVVIIGLEVIPGSFPFIWYIFLSNWLGVIALYILISFIRFRIMLRAEISKV